MLSSDQAAERLQAFKVSGWHKSRIAAVEKLSEPAHAWVRSLDHDGIGDRSTILAKASQFSASGLSDAQRRDLFSSLFPKLADDLDHTWNRLQHASFMHMWRSRPVRASGNARFVAANRDRWLDHVCTDLKSFDPDIEWLAAWAGHLGFGGAHRATALLLASAIDHGGPEGARVFDILRQSGNGEHEIGIPGRHVTTALLNSGNEEAWDYVERMLLAAQRQEGLRQSILESVDIAHPGAFRRMLRLILEKDLVRFASTVRAVDVWFGFLWDSMSTKHAESIIERVLNYLETPGDRAIARTGKDPESAYLALWCDAFEDADAAIPNAIELLNSSRPEQRFVGLHALHWVGFPESIPSAVRLLDDPDLAVAAKALDALEGVSVGEDFLSGLVRDEEFGYRTTEPPTDAIDRLQRLLCRIEKKETHFKPLVFPWGRSKLKAAEVGHAIVSYCKTDNAERLISILDRLDPYGRETAANMLVGLAAHSYGDAVDKHTPKLRSPAARAAIVAMLGDPAKDVRETVGNWLAKLPLEDDEAAQHETLLSRSAADIRTRAIERLAALPDTKLLAVAERLLAGSASEASAAAEILRQMVAKDRAADAARELARAFQSRPKKPPAKDLHAALDAILNVDPHAKWTLENALGLLPDGWKHSRPIAKLRDIPQETATRQTVELLRSLEGLIEKHKEVDVRKARPGEDDPWKSQPGLLGGRYFYGLDPTERHSREDDLAFCPVATLLDEWQLAAGPVATDPAELLRAWAAIKSAHYDWQSSSHAWTQDLVALGMSSLTRLGDAIELFLGWALRRADHRPADILLDQLEGAIARNDLFRKDVDEDDHRILRIFDLSAKKVLERYHACPAVFHGRYQPARLCRILALCDAAAAAFVPYIAAERSSRYYEKSVHTCPIQLQIDEFVELWRLDKLTDNDVLRRLIRTDKGRYGDSVRHHELNHLMERRAGRNARWEHRPVPPALDPILDRIRRRALEIELARGDAPTAASSVIYALYPTGGIDAVIPALANFGKLKLVRGYNWSNSSKAASFSKILSESRPGPDDSPAAFAAAAKSADIPEHRLIELALFAPQWAAHIEHTLKWPGLEEGALWLRAHTKDSSNDYRDEDEPREPWEVRVAELTPISADSRKDGAVDRAWFERCSKRLGPKRWAALYNAAKYASSSAGHKRAQLFADVMQGKTSEKSLTTAITGKRHQDSIRALGLLAVKPGDAGKKQVLARYKVMQEIRRTSRKHGGSMLQASEKRAVEIGMENLAWTAGYPDPLRLQWAMEIEELGKLADGPVVVRVGDTTVTLAVDEEGTPSLTASKKGKDLKSVPPAVKKDKNVAPLAEQVTALKRQGSRVRQALEQAMCRGDEFSAAEVAGLWKHPILRSAMSRLILVGKTKSGGALLGYPDKNGKALRTVDGKHEPLRATDTLRIAHPLDLLPAKSWSAWQHECFAAERVQPFKQVFREIYAPTAAERNEDRSTRYAGQQVQPRQALALFGSRGWVARAEEGVQRTFHHEGLTARVEFEEGFSTPAEIDGLTLAGVSFTRRGSFNDLPVKDVPPRLFSEIMRDMDLVVSVAHRGGVDPEASHSTVEMRAALLREACQLLSLDNVRLDANRALIKGTHGDYALHLGSGTIHRLPGGTVWVIPVHSQHRGRIFLPFADNDPKTAEVMSKALLLARDQEIRDPAILEQVRG